MSGCECGTWYAVGGQLDLAIDAVHVVASRLSFAARSPPEEAGRRAR